MKEMKTGFVYVATGERFKQETNTSLATLKQHMPDAHVTVFCDNPDGLNKQHVDNIQIVAEPKYSFYDKIYAFLNSPYEKTVFIDTDTYVCAPVYELFEILERFEIAAVRDHWSGTKADSPVCFDDFNTGLVCFQNTERTLDVFRNWERIYSEQIATKAKVDHDQPAFRSAVYNSPVTVYVLPKNYNARLTSPIFFGIDFEPKILHGRSDNFERLKKLFSSSRDFRFFIPNGSLVARTKVEVVDAKSGVFFNLATKFAAGLTGFIKKLKG